MSGNLRSGLRRAPLCPRGSMPAYDALPAPLRRWLAGAALPWSPGSALRVFRRALHAARGDVDAALARLSQREDALLARDAARVWGKAHPRAARAPVSRAATR